MNRVRRRPLRSVTARALRRVQARIVIDKGVSVLYFHVVR